MVGRPAKAKATPDTVETDPFDDIAEAFRGALSEFGDGHVKIFMKGPRDTRHAYLRSESIGEGDFETFIEKVRIDYPQGGDFLFKLCDGKGMIKATRQLTLASLPLSEQNKINTSKPDRNDDMFMMMMQMQQRQADAQAQASRDMMTLMMTMSSQSQQATMSMMGAIIPAIAGNKGESAAELLRSMTEAQKNLNPPKENSMAETLQLLQMAKALMPESGGLGGDDETGFGGLMKGAMPLIASLAQAANQPKPQPAPAQIAQTVAPQIQAPTPQPNPAPQPIHAPQPQPEEDPIMLDQMQLMAKYNPVMNAIKKLLEKGHGEQDIIAYIDQQIEVETVSEEDILNLIGGIEAQPELLPQLLSLWQINDPEHVATVRAALTLFVEDDDDTAGDGGNETDTTNNGANGDSGKPD